MAKPMGSNRVLPKASRVERSSDVAQRKRADDTRTTGLDRLDEEQPAGCHPGFGVGVGRAERDDGASRHHLHDLEPRMVGMEEQPVADGELPLGVDAFGVPQLAAGEVLQPLIAVEASAVGAHLRNPRPHVARVGVDLDAVGPAPARIGHELVAGERPRGLLGGEAPAGALPTAGTE